MDALPSLRDLRLARGLTVDELAARSGVSAATIQRIERGATRPRPHAVRHLSEVLGVAPAQVADFAAAASANARPRALVVEDELDQLDLLADVLEAGGYAVRTATDGAEALDVLADQEFDVVLIDLRMPNVDGWELLRGLELRGDTTPVVVLSAHADQPLVPGLPFVAKPYDVPTLLDLLDRVRRRPASP